MRRMCTTSFPVSNFIFEDLVQQEAKLRKFDFSLSSIGECALHRPINAERTNYNILLEKLLRWAWYHTYWNSQSKEAYYNLVLLEKNIVSWLFPGKQKQTVYYRWMNSREPASCCGYVFHIEVEIQDKTKFERFYVMRCLVVSPDDLYGWWSTLLYREVLKKGIRCYKSVFTHKNNLIIVVVCLKMYLSSLEVASIPLYMYYL